MTPSGLLLLSITAMTGILSFSASAMAIASLFVSIMTEGRARRHVLEVHAQLLFKPVALARQVQKLLLGEALALARNQIFR